MKQTRARAIVFDSYGQLGDSTNIDGMFRMIPEMRGFPNNKEIVTRKFRFLRYIVQTDRYQFSGTFNFQVKMLLIIEPNQTRADDRLQLQFYMSVKCDKIQPKYGYT